MNYSLIARFAAALILALTAESLFSADVVIHAGALIDGTGAAPRQKVSISIHDDKITAVEDGFKSPAGTQVIDLSGVTVLRGRSCGRGPWLVRAGTARVRAGCAPWINVPFERAAGLR